MGSLSKKQYICHLSGIKRFQSPAPGKNHHRVSRGLCSESDRSYPRFYSSHRLSRRPSVITNRHLAGYPSYSPGCVEGMSGIGGGVSIGYASESSGSCGNCYNLAIGNRWLYALGMEIGERLKGLVASEKHCVLSPTPLIIY